MRAIAHLPQLAPNGLAARLCLAWLAASGLYYLNIMPVFVDGLVEGLNYSAKQAGIVASANAYGAAGGALLIVFLVKRLPWRPAAVFLLGGLLLMDALSMALSAPDALIACRFVHGLLGGALGGLGFAVIARMLNPERTFGVLLVIQFGLGGLSNLYLPRLVPDFGANALFLALMGFSLIALAMLPFLAKYEVGDGASKGAATQPSKAPVLALLLVLLSIYLFQAGNMLVYAFIFGLGKHFGLQLPFITTAMAVAGWAGILGALAVIGLHTRFGVLRPLLAAMLVAILGNAALHFSAAPALYFAANCGIAIMWSFASPYLLGMAAAFDKAGQMAALGAFASTMGMASGPLAGGLLLADDNYPWLINIAVIILTAAMLAALIPARAADKQRPSADWLLGQ